MFAARTLLVGLGLLLGGSALAGQAVAVSVGAGFAHPVRSFKPEVKEGTFALGAVTISPRSWPVGIRLEAVYAEFRGRDAGTFVFPRHRIEAVRASVEYTFVSDQPHPSPLRGWAFGGLGAYYDKTDRGQPEAPLFGRTYPGLVVGVGVAYKFGLVTPFFEAEYNSVWRSGPDDKYFPLLLGVRFGGR